MTECVVDVRGMDCADEVALIRRALAPLAGIGPLDFDLVHGRVHVSFDAAEIDAPAIVSAVRGTGLEAALSRSTSDLEASTGPAPERARPEGTAANRWLLTSGSLFVAGWIVQGLSAETWLEGLAGHARDGRATLLYAAAALAATIPMSGRAFASLRHARLDMHVLVCLSVLGAAAIGQWSEGAAVAFLFALAHRMEAWSLERARAALSTLEQRHPMNARNIQQRSAPTERWIERFATIYTPVVVAAAVLLTTLPPLVDGQWREWFYRALVFLVLACPCALVISTPVTVVAAITSAARRGVLVKGGAPLERAAGARAATADALAQVGVLLARAADAPSAITEAHVVIVDASLDDAPRFLVWHARRAMAVIRQNVGLALVTKLAFLLSASVGAAPLWMAVLADTGATVLVTLNGLRLLQVRKSLQLPGSRA